MFANSDDDYSLEAGRKTINDEIVNELIFNSLKGKKYFNAVCLSNPVQIQQQVTQVGTKLYNPVKVRPLDIHGFALPDPCVDNIKPSQIASIIQAHPIAFGVRPLGDDERIPVYGDILKCYFSIDGPNNGGRLRGIRYQYSLKSHNFKYDCAEKFLKERPKFPDNPLLLRDFTGTPPPTPPAPLRRRPPSEDEDEEEEKTTFVFPRNTHPEATKEYGDWFKWNVLSGNYPKISVRLGSSTMQFENSISSRHFCDPSSPKAMEKGLVRYYNWDAKIPLPKKPSDRFPKGNRLDPYMDIESKYIRTMLLRILPFNRTYKWPYDAGEFQDHLQTYPELAAHWLSVKGVHQCSECVAAAEAFWNTRTDKSELERVARTPDNPGGSGIRDQDWIKYLIPENWTPPEPKKYTAKSGDSVYRISAMFSIDRDHFRSWNNIVGNFIGIGVEYIVEDPNSSKFRPQPLIAQLVVLGGHDYARVPCEDSKIQWVFDGLVYKPEPK